MIVAIHESSFSLAGSRVYPRIGGLGAVGFRQLKRRAPLGGSDCRADSARDAVRARLRDCRGETFPIPGFILVISRFRCSSLGSRSRRRVGAICWRRRGCANLAPIPDTDSRICHLPLAVMSFNFYSITSATASTPPTATSPVSWVKVGRM